MTQKQLNKKQLSFQRKMSKPWLLRFYLFFNIPMGFLSGMKVTYLDMEKATTTAAYRWLNRNPFKSMYFGVQNMAAELSTGAIALMAIQGQSPTIAGIITRSESEFLKQARSRVYFTCEEGSKIFETVEACKKSDEGQAIRVKTEGKTADGTLVSVFYFTWSFKRRMSI